MVSVLFVGIGVVLAVKEEAAAGELIHTAYDVEHSALAAARLAEDNQELALAHVEVHALEDLDLRVALAEDLGHAAQRDDGLLFLRKAEVQALARRWRWP